MQGQVVENMDGVIVAEPSLQRLPFYLYTNDGLPLATCHALRKLPPLA
jgi:hypothetical protein